jgi:hypothetical protein
MFCVHHFRRLAISIFCSKEVSTNNTLLKYESAHSIVGPAFSFCETSCRLKCLYGRHVDDMSDVSNGRHTYSTKRHTDQRIG